MAREYWEREDLLSHFPAGDARRTLARVLDCMGDRAGRAYWQELSRYWAFEPGGGARRIPIYLKPTHLSVDEDLLGLLPDDLRSRVRGLEHTYPSIDFQDGIGRSPASGSTRQASTATDEPRAAVLLAWDPEAWGWREEDVWTAVAAIEGGTGVEVQCATGVRRAGVEPGDPVYLVSHAAGAEGIVASGVALGQVFSAEEERGGAPVNVVDVALEQIRDPAAPLSLAAVEGAAPRARWDRPGSLLAGPAQEQVERLWEDSARGGAEASSAVSRSGQARMLDSERRKKVEDTAQDMLMKHYRDLGWEVEDTRFGNPFDARATKDGETIYLEAKGTTSEGHTVTLTRGEVRHARLHRGQHVIGILSGIRFDVDGAIVPESGSFRVLELDPQDDDLDPIAYDWKVPLTVSTDDPTYPMSG